MRLGIWHEAYDRRPITWGIWRDISHESYGGKHMTWGIWREAYDLRHMAWGIWREAYGVRHMTWVVWHHGRHTAWGKYHVRREAYGVSPRTWAISWNEAFDEVYDGHMMWAPISIFPRWNFLLLAANQLVNHVDKINEMGAKKFRNKIIIRT